MSVKHNNTKYETYVTAGLHVSTLIESSSGPHTKNVLYIVGSPTLTISAVNDNESE